MDWYLARSPQAAAEFAEELTRAVELIAGAPHRWARDSAGTRRFLLHRFPFALRMFGSNPEQLRSLAAWLLEQEAEEVVMESAQYWRPVWEVLERYWKPICEKREGARRRSGTLHLAQAQSNRGRRGRKRDFIDAERLVKRLVSRELVLSFVPDPEQRLWRTVGRRKYQLTRDRVRLQNQLEALLEEAHIKLSSMVSDLLVASARRMPRRAHRTCKG